MPDWLHQAWTPSSLPVCWCWHPCNKLPSHPKSHDMILSFFLLLFFVYSHISLKEPSGILSSRTSFLYCQNVSARDWLGGHRRFCTFTGLFFLLKQYEQSESSQRSHLWNVGQISSFSSVCTWMLIFIHWENVLSAALSCKNTCDDLILFLSAGLSWCKWQDLSYVEIMYFFVNLAKVLSTLFMSSVVISRKAIETVRGTIN